MFAELAEDSVLDAVRHSRLIQDLDHVCSVANVPRSFVHRSMKLFCDADEIDYVVNFRLYREHKAGLVMVNKTNPDTRCMAICGALVRNFIDARVIPLNTLLDMIEAKDVPEPTVMIIPNLFVSQVGKALPAWKIQAVYDLLLTRFTQNRPTVVAVESMTGLQSAYGLAFAQHLQAHYKLAD
jgi:hypothetical protein